MCINSCAGAYAKGTDMITREQTNQRKSQINRHMDFFTNKLFLIALTFIVFVLAQQLQRATGVKLLNPILVSIVVLICILMSAKLWSGFRLWFLITGNLPIIRMIAHRQRLIAPKICFIAYYSAKKS